MKNTTLKRKAAILSLLVGIAMFFAKTGAYILTGSAAILSDAAESVVHVLATTMALYSIILSSKPADDSHPYGHGHIEYFSAGVEGLLIIIAAGYIIYEAIPPLIYGSILKQLDTGVIIISAAGIINLFLGFYLVRTGKKTNSITLVADGKHVLTDSYTSIGVIIGVILVMITGLSILDPLFAIAVALNILSTGYKLIRQSIGGLMIESNPLLLGNIASELVNMKKDYWIDLHELRFWQSGESTFIDFHLIFPRYYTIQQSHTEERVIKEQLNRVFPDAQIKIHFDYCQDELCKYCKYADCFLRKFPATEEFLWNVDKLSGKPVYQLNR